MTSQEAAMTFASASSSCKRDKCPYHKQCNGFSDQCLLKDVSLILRDQDAQILTLQSKIDELNAMIAIMKQHEHEVEGINERYKKMILSFKVGKRPVSRLVAGRRVYKPRKPRKKKDPVEMDGDKRYEQPDPDKRPPDPPLVMI